MNLLHLRKRLAQLVFPPMRAAYDLNVPYGAAIVIVWDQRWTQEDVDKLTETLEAVTSKNVAVTCLTGAGPFAAPSFIWFRERRI